MKSEVKFNQTGSLDALEHKYILEYLESKGFSLKDLLYMSKEEARRLMAEACSFASLKLAEIETRAQFVRKIEYGV